MLKQAIETSPEPKENWQQLLMASYAETGQAGDAVQMAEKIAAKSPDRQEGADEPGQRVSAGGQVRTGRGRSSRSCAPPAS